MLEWKAGGGRKVGMEPHARVAEAAVTPCPANLLATPHPTQPNSNIRGARPPTLK